MSRELEAVHRIGSSSPTKTGLYSSYLLYLHRDKKYMLDHQHYLLVSDNQLTMGVCAMGEDQV